MEVTGGSSGRICRLILGTILFLTVFQQCHGWDNAEYEMYDLVEEVNKNFYEVLGVAPDATSKEIKSAYRKLSVKLHPDKNPSPDASEKFRQLVGIYEVLKDDNLRKAYEDVLVNGLPNWRQPVFYFRRARKLAMWQVAIILLTIISIGQYLAGWGSYFEKRLSMKEVFETRFRKRSRKGQSGLTDAEIEAEMARYLQKPSLWNIAPFQILRGIKYLIFYLPGDIKLHYEHQKEMKEEEAREQERLRLEEEEQQRIAQEPKKPRKRKTFVAPKKEESDGEDENADDNGEAEEKAPVKPKYVSGGLWTDEDLGELAKLCGKYPGGTPERWDKISDALRRPVPEVIFMAKKVMDRLSKKQEEEQESMPQLKVKVKTKGGKADAVAAASGDIDNVANWSADEQKYLEKALALYPKGALERWDKIAAMVPDRTKEECMQRFKYLAELVKKKKEKTETPEESSSPLEEPEKIVSPPDPEEKASSANATSSDKDTVERKNSSSSNKSNSDSDWCMVDS